jgi:hypothetical protein
MSDWRQPFRLMGGPRGATTHLNTPVLRMPTSFIVFLCATRNVGKRSTQSANARPDVSTRRWNRPGYVSAILTEPWCTTHRKPRWVLHSTLCQVPSNIICTLHTQGACELLRLPPSSTGLQVCRSTLRSSIAVCLLVVLAGYHFRRIHTQGS